MLLGVARSDNAGMRTMLSSRPDVPALLERWVSHGIITTDQAARMRADVPGMASPAGGTPETGRGTSLVTEAMGYLGGVIILVASGLVTGWFWEDMSTTVRLALAGAVTVLLVVAGAAVPRHLGAPGDRLRSVLWLLASAALAAFLSLAGSEKFAWDGETVALFAAGGTAVMSAVLWYEHPRLLQHAATFVPLLVTAATATSLLPGSEMLTGVAVLAVGAVWGVLSWGGVISARRHGTILGAVAMAFGSMLVVGEGWGTALALLTVGALVLFAVASRDLVLLAVASAGALFVLPASMSRLFPGMLAAALALLAVGVLLVAAAVATARRRRARPTGPARRDWSQGPALVAIVIATTIAVSATLAILLAAGL